MAPSSDEPILFVIKTDPSTAASSDWPDSLRVRFRPRSGLITRAGIRKGEVSADTPLYFTIEAAGAEHHATPLALGHSVWGEDDYSTPEIGWHVQRPCRHGLYRVGRGIQPRAPDDGFDADVDGAITCLEARARLIARVLTAEATTAVPEPPHPLQAAAGTAEPEDLESVIGDLLPDESDPAAIEEWRRSGAVRDILERAAAAGWDVAVRDWEPRVLVLHAPDGGGPGGVPTGLASAGSAAPISRTYYHLRERPTSGGADDTGDRITFDDPQSCPGGAHTARVSGDIAEWHWTSPIVSAPFEGWISVIGDEVVFVNWVPDTYSAWTGWRVLPEGRWQLPPTERDWLLAARAMYG